MTQTEAHQGTIAEVVNTCYGPTCRSAYAARDKHGNYQTLSSCNNLIDSCGAMVWESRSRNEDVGEAAAPRIGDLGPFHAQWTGYTPWDGKTFLGGGAGSIRSKMELTAAHMADATYDTCASWCSLSKACCNQAGYGLTFCTSEWSSCKQDCLYSHCTGTYCY